MKRATLLCLCVLLLLCGCKTGEENKRIKDDNGIYHKGVWVTYTELNSMLSADFKSEFSNVLQTCKAKGITDIFVHVRAFCDAYYPSKLFPMAESAKAVDFDILEFMVSSAHQKNIRFHAWLNPYRVRTADNNIDNLSKESPAYKWGSSDNLLVTESGIYLNPASYEARMLVTDGVREILKNYAVDGIHFDDYFYPLDLAEEDRNSYDKYFKEAEIPVSIENWRRGNVNALISGVYTAIKFVNKDIIFSISPAADMEKNYNSRYADITLWGESGCVDWLIPQLYFGFNYPDSSFRFDYLLDAWKSEFENRKAKLLIGLASYKIGTETPPDSEEWEKGEEIIKRQEKICQEDKDIYGHIYFSYSYIK